MYETYNTILAYRLYHTFANEVQKGERGGRERGREREEGIS